MSEEYLDIFMHVPKTGGTTLSAIFRKQYKANEIFDHDSYEFKIKKVDQLGVEEKRKIKAVAGHYNYGIHQHFSKPSNYFTMLRDPVDRVISLYYFLQNYHPGYERVRDMTLEEFVLKDPEAQNHQTILACGDPENPDITKAKENLKTFTVVGVTELFNETLFCLKKEYDWGDIHYTRKNITKNRLAKEEVPSGLINLIRKYNAMDLELYDYAKKLLNRKLKSLTVDEQKQLEKFKLEQSALN
ncbi:sulfotransferase family 2 domain-containing protein [Bacillus sp. ISL-4]|uniref:sulfotransferase family 2 domain-containing protein n=1 Tax=Bacillus sp. ISL-4 TaxID=2819125 RepID=UPI001BE60F0A|nr:sulfotransferase family 2 domain-containing protein [Bacillus sp. ISL-4]MBT2667112.1 sulfotransferase family 2 domain-containing protein [Bacillus sp. ISL-4]MBT2670362.1 sulfotransferase family 2 domain-containing protein [Streptomyces sp. ISL-14]